MWWQWYYHHYHFICPSLHVQCIFLAPCYFFYSLDAKYRKQCDYIICFALGTAFWEILAPCSRAWHTYASCLRIYKNAPGWLACHLANLGVGVSEWYFADRCILFLCCELADTPSEQVIRFAVHHANHSYTLLVHCCKDLSRLRKRVSPHLPKKYHTDKLRHPWHLRSDKNIRWFSLTSCLTQAITFHLHL